MSVAEEYNIDYDVYEPYALSGKTFTLLDPGTEDSALAGLYPVEFKKAG